MPVIKKDTEQIKKEELKNLNQVSSIRINQIEEASGNESEASRQETSEEKKSEAKSTAAEETGSKKYSDVIMARLTTGKRNIFKAFFCENGITMNSGIEMCIEYVMDQVRAGNLKISKAGIK